MVLYKDLQVLGRRHKFNLVLNSHFSVKFVVTGHVFSRPKQFPLPSFQFFTSVNGKRDRVEVDSSRPRIRWGRYVVEVSPPSGGWTLPGLESFGRRRTGSSDHTKTGWPTQCLRLAR